MNNITIVLISAFLVSCTTAEVASVQPAEPPAAGVNGEVVQVDIADASGPEIVCTKVVRPGTRMVVGQSCSASNGPGVTVQTREEIQREISGQGWSAGWKTQEQIEAERRISLGNR